MRIRIRFSKEGPVRFVGHLDFMRSFQKYVKKSGLSACYSGGFSPHMLMSFAAPLGVGEETLSDYVDVDFSYRDTAPLTDQELYRLKDMGLANDELPLPPSRRDFCRILTSAMPEGVKALDAARVGLIKGSKAMSLVRYASYQIHLLDGFLQDVDIRSGLAAFSAQNEIVIHKKTKKAEKDVDIRPMIVHLDGDGGTVQLTCASGSVENLKPSAVMEAFSCFADKEYDPYGFRVVRTELYDENRVSLLELGTLF
ncbi:MAG: DUF2344 domain-containing protein [Lachnospiraceae bacterium]|nr:DUF2344 domain-containing protein [Lachnospiraceae bacterium]